MLYQPVGGNQKIKYGTLEEELYPSRSFPDESFDTPVTKHYFRSRLCLRGLVTTGVRGVGI